jgi:predicted ferric reductase
MARYITYAITVIFIFIIIIQLNTYLAFIQLPSAIEKDPTVSTIVHERYKRDYTVLLYYAITALLAGSALLVRSHLKRQQPQQKSKLFSHEWRVLSATCSLKQCLSLSLLIALNGAFLTSQATISKDDAQLYVQELANRCAQLAIVNSALAVTLSAKLSIVQRYFYSLPTTIQWHQWMGRLAFLEALFHGTFQLQRNYRRQDGDIFMTLTTNVRYVTGTCMLLGMMVLVFGSHPIVRQVSYRFFRISHMASFAVLILMGVLHHWCFSLFYAAVLMFWVLDQVDRFYATEVVSLEALPGQIVRLRVKVPYRVEHLLPGQFVSLSFSPSWIKSLVYSHSFSICKIENSGKVVEVVFYKMK